MRHFATPQPLSGNAFTMSQNLACAIGGRRPKPPPRNNQAVEVVPLNSIWSHHSNANLPSTWQLMFSLLASTAPLLPVVRHCSVTFESSTIFLVRETPFVALSGLPIGAGSFKLNKADIWPLQGNEFIFVAGGNLPISHLFPPLIHNFLELSLSTLHLNPGASGSWILTSRRFGGKRSHCHTISFLDFASCRQRH